MVVDKRKVEEKITEWVMSTMGVYSSVPEQYTLSLNSLQIITLQSICLLAKKHPVFQLTNCMEATDQIIEEINKILRTKGFSDEEIEHLNTKDETVEFDNGELHWEDS